MSDLKSRLPGRLGDSNRSLATEPRADPRIVAVLESVGSFAPGVEPAAPDASVEECIAYTRRFEEAEQKGHAAVWSTMPDYDDVEQTTETIEGVDGNEILLFVHRPKDNTTEAAGAGERIPCVVHTHGGGMVVMRAEDPLFVRWRNELARLGMLVVGVEFRNGGGRGGDHPFPAGLNDCASAVRWVDERRAELGVSKILMNGESGGANLSIATALKARKEGWLSAIDGVFSMCPYIYGGYADPDPALMSLEENDGYMLLCSEMATLARVYDPSGEHAKNPLAWPYFAERDDLQGLPPHVISVNELDPLRDEGLAYYRKLAAAGVTVTARIIAGTTHGADVGMPDVTPEISYASLDAIHSFAMRL